MGELVQEFRARGSVQVEAIRPGLAVASILFLANSPVLLIGGAVLLWLGLSRVLELSWILGAVFLLIGSAAVFIGLRLRQLSRSEPGTAWVVDRSGITVGGIALAWDWLDPTRLAMEPAAYSGGLELAVVLPLTDRGRAHALTLSTDTRRALNPGVRDTPLTGPQPLTTVRIPRMKEMSAREFAAALDEIREGLAPQVFDA